MSQPSTAEKVIICGAGIGGLTLAHELKKRGFDVTMYERNEIVGGLARSSYHEKDGKLYPTEYSWRIYGAGYRNLLRVLKEIPRSNDSTKSIFNNLVKVSTFVFPRFDKDDVVIAPGKSSNALAEGFTKSDKVKLAKLIFEILTMSTERMNSLDHVRWKDYTKHFSDEANKYVTQLWGPVLGMDTTSMSFPVVARMLPILAGGFLGVSGYFYLMDKPTNDAWFDEWTDFLTKQGVVIKKNHEILDIKMSDGKVSGVVVKDRATGNTFEDTADYYSLGLSVESVAAMTAKNAELQKVPTLQKMAALTEAGKQVQLSVQLFLNKKLVYPTEEKTVLYLPDTPWALIIEPQDLVWDKTYSTDERVKTVLSVGITQTDIPGILYNKPFIECTREEVEKEMWAQMQRSYKFSRIKTEDGEHVDPSHTVLFYIWDSFDFDEHGFKGVWEPKFSNNVNAFAHQPSQATEVENLFFSTAYSKTDRFIYSMEAAAESGTRAANEIVKRHNGKGKEALPLTKVITFNLSPKILRPLNMIDGWLFKRGKKHLAEYFGNGLMLVSVYAAVLVALIVGIVVALI